MRLDEITTFGNVLSSFHFVSSQHPYFDFLINILLLALMRSRMVSGTSSCNLSSTAVAPSRYMPCYN